MRIIYALLILYTSFSFVACCEEEFSVSQINKNDIKLSEINGTTFIYENNKLIKVPAIENKSQEQNYIYDNSGNLSAINYFGNEQIVRRTLITYNNKDQLVEIIYQNLEETLKDKNRVVFSYNSIDQLSRITQYNSSTGVLTNIQELVCLNGNIIERKHQDAYGNVSHIETFEYDENPSYKYCHLYYIHWGANLSLNNITRIQTEVFNPFIETLGLDIKIFYEYENGLPISLQFENYSVLNIEYTN